MNDVKPFFTKTGEVQVVNVNGAGFVLIIIIMSDIGRPSLAYWHKPLFCGHICRNAVLLLQEKVEK